jgi:hypothetical protein
MIPVVGVLSSSGGKLCPLGVALYEIPPLHLWILIREVPEIVLLVPGNQSGSQGEVEEPDSLPSVPFQKMRPAPNQAAEFLEACKHLRNVSQHEALNHNWTILEQYAVWSLIFRDSSLMRSNSRSICFMKNVFPVPQSPKRPIEIGGSTSLAASTEQSASTSRFMPSRSSPEVVSDRKPTMVNLNCD